MSENLNSNTPTTAEVEQPAESTEPKVLDLKNLESAPFKQLVRDFDGGLIFSDRHVPERDSHLLGNIFMPLMFGAFENYPKEEVDKIGMVYEYLDKAGPRSTNGYPNFMSFRLLSKEDTTRLVAKVLEIRQAREGVLDGPDAST